LFKSYSKFRDFLKQPTTEDSAPPITIWVHGTKAFFSKYFLQNFFFCYPGLNPAESFSQKYHLHEIAKNLHLANPKRFNFNTFYFFGWSGSLSYEARQEAAHELYSELKELVEQYEDTFGQKPHIRIITHSHGGNVALHLAECVEDEFFIDELIMLAVPVQKKTSEFSLSPVFKKIYSIYSTVDTIQIMDPQGFHYWRKYRNKSFKEKLQSPFFSERTFPEQENMLQIKLRTKRRGISHIEFLLDHFLKALPGILDDAELQQIKTKRRNLTVRI
jgi:hypothetical protein